MDYENLKFDVENNIGRITLNRPNSANAITIPLVKELLDVAIRCESEEKVRVLILQGEGPIFCAGGDLKFMTEQKNLQAAISEMIGILHVALSKIDHLEAPMIGAITGTAAGAGLSLVSACDMAIAGENVKFSSAYTAAGLTPDGSSTFHLPRSIGKKRTMELMLTNRVLSSKEALDWGLINKVVNDEDVISETNKLAMKIAKGPTKAFGGVKEMLRQSFSNGLETQMELESQIFSEQLKGLDGPEGIEAFTSKRKPEFKGK